jgi:hypothetical protein
MLLLLGLDAESFQVATVLSKLRLKLRNFDIFLHILLKQLPLLLLGLLKAEMLFPTLQIHKENSQIKTLDKPPGRMVLF